MPQICGLCRGTGRRLSDKRERCIYCGGSGKKSTAQELQALRQRQEEQAQERRQREFRNSPQYRQQEREQKQRREAAYRALANSDSPAYKCYRCSGNGRQQQSACVECRGKGTINLVSALEALPIVENLFSYYHECQSVEIPDEPYRVVAFSQIVSAVNKYINDVNEAPNICGDTDRQGGKLKSYVGLGPFHIYRVGLKEYVVQWHSSLTEGDAFFTTT